MVEFGVGGAQRQKSLNGTLRKEQRGLCRERHTIDVVEHGRLAHRVLVLGRRVADIVADLGTTDGGSDGVYLVRLLMEVRGGVEANKEILAMPVGYA